MINRLLVQSWLRVLLQWACLLSGIFGAIGAQAAVYKCVSPSGQVSYSSVRTAKACFLLGSSTTNTPSLKQGNVWDTLYIDPRSQHQRDLKRRLMLETELENGRTIRQQLQRRISVAKQRDSVDFVKLKVLEASLYKFQAVEAALKRELSSLPEP